MDKKRILLAVTNDLSGDQRMHRIASSLHEAGHEVMLIGREKPDSLSLTPRSYATHRLKLRFHRGKAFYLAYNWALFRFLLKQKADIFTANDLDTLLATSLAARICKVRLIYDTHEYFTEVPELVHRPLTRSVWLTLERWLFPSLQTVYTVNASLAGIYTDRYNVPVQVIRNLPFAREASTVVKSDKIILYQGALNVGRGLELLVEAMTLLPDYTLWIVGKGDVEEKLHKQVEEVGLVERVIFKGFVPPAELVQLTPQASLGVSLEENLGKNYYYASPNKVYDYIQARIPILVSDLPEMRRIVEEYRVGDVIPGDRRSPAGLAAILRTCLEDQARYARWVAACEVAALQLTWEKERNRLISLYEGEGETGFLPA